MYKYYKEKELRVSIHGDFYFHHLPHWKGQFVDIDVPPVFPLLYVVGWKWTGFPRSQVMSFFHPSSREAPNFQ